jgi:hypothetical protein
MLIVRMIFSRAMVCAGNQTYETLRSSLKLHGKSGMVTLNDKDVSSNASELDAASFHHKVLKVRLPKMLKPVTREGETNKSLMGAIRVIGERSCRKIGRGTDDPYLCHVSTNSVRAA